MNITFARAISIHNLMEENGQEDRFTKGQAPLSKETFTKLCANFTGKYAVRNRCIFIFGYYTGFRINEILSVKFGTIFENTACKFRKVIFMQKELMKSKKRGRKMVINEPLRQAIMEWVDVYTGLIGKIDLSDYLFVGRKNKHATRLRKESFALILHRACDEAGIPRVGTHCMRKSFANNMYQLCGKDIAKTQRAMGHSDPRTTLRYLELDFNDIADVVNQME